MDLTRAWVTYVVVRLLAFVVPFALVMLALPGWQWNWLLGAVFGALASQSISVIALRPHRERIAQGLAERRAAEERPRETRRAIDLEEDADLDAHATEAEADSHAIEAEADEADEAAQADAHAVEAEAAEPDATASDPDEPTR